MKKPPKHNSSDLPVVISFFFGHEYYHDAANKLKMDCERLGLEHHIVEADLDPNIDWIGICRHKVQFIKNCVETINRPVLWLDIDTRLLNIPEELRSSGADIGFFLKEFAYLRDFDTTTADRLIVPFALYYGNTARALKFVKKMADLEGSYKGSDATDAYFLHEAWLKFQEQLSIVLMPPRLITDGLKKSDDAAFLIGRSGNVPLYMGQAVQHKPGNLTARGKQIVLIREANELLESKDINGAIEFFKRALHYSPENENLPFRIARLSKSQGKLKDALAFLKKFSEEQKDYDRALRFKAEDAIENEKFVAAEEMLNKLKDSGNRLDINWANSRMVRVELESRAKRQQLNDTVRPVLWWMEGPYPGNFGDMINPYVIEKLSGLPPRRGKRGDGIIAIGSTIKFATSKTKVWGAGTPRQNDKLDPKATYLAVRGPLTRKLVTDCGGKCPEIYGDPAWFLPHIYKPKSQTKKYKLGLIKHYANACDLETTSAVKDIPVIRSGYSGIEKFIDEVNECDAILSTSLHGIIVAHAYGIPARWCKVIGAENPIAGDDTKFYDYLLSVGLDKSTPLLLKKGTTVSLKFAQEATELPESDISLDKLAKAAPFTITVPPWSQDNASELLGSHGKNLGRKVQLLKKKIVKNRHH